MPLNKAYSLNFIFGGKNEDENGGGTSNKRFGKLFRRKSSASRYNAALFTSKSQNKISELTPELANILKENQEKKQCEVCQTNLDETVNRTLQPMTHLSDMYSSLPRKLSSSSRPSKQKMADPLTNPQLIHSNEKLSAHSQHLDKENTHTAASFFLRAAQKLNLGSNPSRNGSLRKMKSKKTSTQDSEMESTQHLFLTNFSDLILHTPPQAPPSLFKYGTLRKGDGHGKVKVILRTVNRRHAPTSESCLTVDARKKQVLLREASSTTSADTTKRFEKAPRLYSFDNIFTHETTQQELCAGTLVDLLHTVVNGNDACLMTYGYPKLGKSAIMTGRDDSVENIGIVPCAISWLYQLIDDRKQRTGARFSVRVSAVEVVGKSENLKDLLGEQGNGSMCSSGGTSPSVYLPRERASSIQLSDFTELRAPTAEKAAFYFDAAVSSRTTPTPVVNEDGDVMEDPEEQKNSNMIFTLHVYQYMIDKVGSGEIHGGRSRFHLIDLSGCSRKKRSRDNGQGAWLPLSALGNVIVSIANGTKHIPHRNSKLTTLLREAMGSLSARVTMVANVSQDPKHCFETLSTFQVTSRIHRSRKRKSRYSSTSSSGGDSSCDERRNHRRRVNKPVTPLLRMDTCQSDHVVESEFTSTSAAEESCDTVIYLGPGGRCLSERDLTDFEHPPQPKPVEKVPVSQLKTTTRKNVHSKEPSICPSNQNGENKIPKKSEEYRPEGSTNKKFRQEGQFKTVPPTEPPIVVNINTRTLPKRPLEEKADSLLKYSTLPNREPKYNKEYKLIDTKNDSCGISQNENSAYEAWKYSDSLPIRSLNKTYSITNQREINNNTIESDQHYDEGLPYAQSRSANSSPCKRGRSLTRRDNRKTRSNSLDKNLLKEMSEGNEGENQMTHCRSTETVSSTATVDNFERQLVSKIAERFAVEEEFSLSKKPTDTVVQDYYIDDELDAIGATLDCTSPRRCVFDVEATTIITAPTASRSPANEVTLDAEYRENEVINCNHCIGECTCYLSNSNNNNNIHNADTDKYLHLETTNQEFDSAEDTDERTDKELRFLSVRNRNSFSSCDSHLNSPRNFDKHPPSEGVSSGYESMRCESNANIHLSDSEKKSPRSRMDSKRDNKTIYELDDEIRGINVNDDHKTRFARTSLFRAQIKELINQRQDLKEELQQTLKRLVLNRVPLPDIDERLREISMQNRNTPQMLSRENRILERKVRVCKSHLEIVNCLNNATTQSDATSPRKSPKKRSQVQKLSAKIKSKLTKPPTSPRKAYKVTSV